MKRIAFDTVRNVFGQTQRQGNTVSEGLHPEKPGILSYCSAGRGIDLVCGSRRSSTHCFGVDTIKNPLKWKRVLKPGGCMVLVVPVEGERDTSAPGPAHKHCFTPESLDRFIYLTGGLEKVESRVLLEKRSFLTAYRKR